MSLRKFKEARQAQIIHENVNDINDGAESLARNALGQAEMLNKEKVHIDNRPSYSGLTTREFTDEPEGQNIVQLQNEKFDLGSFTVEKIAYLPAPERIDGKLPLVDEVASSLMDAYRAPDGSINTFDAIRMVGDGISLTIDYGDGLSDPLICSRTFEDEQGGIRQATAKELIESFSVNP